jgi:inhibitor of cysteine peptidase
MTDDKFIIMGIDDDRSKDIAEVIGNKTCKKIIDFLAETKEASEKDISDALKIPLNTIEYNLNKLIKVGLVEKTKNFFWSIKGKKIVMYKLANKHIVISPKSKPKMDTLKALIPFLSIIVIALIALIVFFNMQDGSNIRRIDNILPNNADVLSEAATAAGLRQFSSNSELVEFINASNDYQGGYYGARESFAVGGMAKASMAPSAADSSNSVTSSGAGGGTSDYSKTNIQVEGVDEPDIVKNDGKYIYTLSRNKVSIVEAYPATQMKKVSEIKVDSATNLFINKDQLIIFKSSYDSVSYKGICPMYVEGYYGRGCGGYSIPKSVVIVYNIKDRTKPELELNYSVEGNYIDSRMVGDYVYMVSTKSAGIENPEPPVYYENDVKSRMPITDVYYFDYPDTSYVFTTISSLNLKNGDINRKAYLTGGANQIFVSMNNIYLTYPKTLDYKNYFDLFIEKVVRKIMPESSKQQIDDIMNSKDSYHKKTYELKKMIYFYSNTVEAKEKERFDTSYFEALQSFEEEISKQREKTAIHKIEFSDGKIEYKAVGDVPGLILNQFSMDEYNDYFRIATTSGQVWEGNSANNIYVLDKNLKLTGSIEDLAKGEKIYSARFMGERGYLVTFKKVDPLFVIDLSNPKELKVLGYLKIPGYSDYLHPYDENHVIGIGKEAIDASEEQTGSRNLDFAWYQGVKISLFDVTDVTHPIEKSKFVIGDRGTDSPALYDPKAFLFNKEKKLLVLPINLAEIDRTKYRTCSPEEQNSYDRYNSYCLTTNTYGEQVWQGAYVLNIDENEISLRGKVSHNDEIKKYGPASEEPIGASRVDNDGNIWTKVGKVSWKIMNNVTRGYEYTSWGDSMIDSLPGGINYHNYNDYQNQIQRSLYMDNVLYTVSQAKIKANDLTNLREINEVDLGFKEIYYPMNNYATV